MSFKLNDGHSNKKLCIYLLILVVMMIGFGFAMVPIYNLFCKKTGYAGTIQRAENGYSGDIIDSRQIIVMFNADVAKDLEIYFKPNVHSMKVHPGENALAFYRVVNKTDRLLKGIAIYNVAPHKAAKYFHKIYCFCFEEQAFTPHADLEFPVTFYIDPKINVDKDLLDLDTITLSYMFFQYPD